MSIEVVNKIVMRKLTDIKPYFRNPRTNEKTVKALVELIPKVGFNVPIVIDPDGVIIKGHARYKAAFQLGLEQVPCVVSHADEESQKLDRLSDNKTSELSEWVTDDLLHELDMLNTDFDLSTLGFPELNIDDVIGGAEGFSFDDMGFDSESPATEGEEERRLRYQQFLESQPKAPPAEMITSAASIERALQKQQNVPEKPKRYFKMVCEHCGHIMFVAEGDAIFEDR